MQAATAASTVPNSTSRSTVARGSGSSFLLNTQVASHGYAHLGDTSNLATRVREQTTAQVGRDFGRYGALSVAYVRQGYEAQASQQTFTLSDNLQVGRRGYFSASISRSSGTPGSTSVYLLYTMALSAGRAATLSGLGGSGPSAPRNALAAGMARPKLLQKTVSAIETGAGDPALSSMTAYAESLGSKLSLRTARR